MLHPSYKELIEKMNETAPGEENRIYSRYSLVLTAAGRARQINDIYIAEREKEKKLGIENHAGRREKNLSIAVSEIEEGRLHIQNDPMNPANEE